MWRGNSPVSLLCIYNNFCTFNGNLIIVIFVIVIAQVIYGKKAAQRQYDDNDTVKNYRRPTGKDKEEGYIFYDLK